MKALPALTAAASAIAVLATTAVAAPIQWSTDVGGNGHWYELNTDLLTWDDARTEAESRGGYLATITSAAEDAFVSNVLGELMGSAWLGGSDAASEGEWFWVTGPEAGTQFWDGDKTGNAVGGAYSNWDLTMAPGGSNNGEDSDYLVMFSAFGTVWSDSNGSNLLKSLIEYDSLTTDVPAPASAALLLAGLAGLGIARRRRH